MKSHLQTLVTAAAAALIKEAGADIAVPSTVQIDATKDPKHGDFASNLALVLAKPLGQY